MIRIVTVAYQNLGIVEKLLESIQRFVKVPHEVIIWDNSPNANSLPLIKQANNHHYIHHGINLGFSKAVNQAIGYSTAKAFTHLLLINPDAVLNSALDQNIFQKLVNENAIIGLRVFNDIELKIRQQSARSFPNIFTSFTGREGILTRLMPKNRLSTHYLRDDLDSLTPLSPPHKVDWVSGCAMFCALDLWRKLGGFDERYFLYVEDVDFGRTAQAMGIPQLYYPIIDVVHYSRTTSNALPWKSDFFHHLGMYKYWWKWSSLKEKPFFILAFLGIAMRYFFRRIIGSNGRTST